MPKFPLKLEKSLEKRKQMDAYRTLAPQKDLADFSSNDYLGFAASEEIYSRTKEILSENGSLINGSTGSRLLSGNHPIFAKAEGFLKDFHQSEAALLFNSGYDANIAFFSSVPQRGDIIFYDELSHASIRDGISLGKAKAYKFRHNDIEDLRQKLERERKNNPAAEIFLVTESVFSMDGDIPNLRALANFSSANNCLLIVDEAHATGVFGNNGRGLVQELQIQDQVFARIITFGKAIGCHGAAILGSAELKNYLVNFARSFIYTTAMPPHSVATILAAYQQLELKNAENSSPLAKLHQNIVLFKSEIQKNKLDVFFLKSDSAIQSCLIPGNSTVKDAAQLLRNAGFNVKPILSPTVPEGTERLRFCLHSFNTQNEIEQVVRLLANFINSDIPEK